MGKGGGEGSECAHVGAALQLGIAGAGIDKREGLAAGSASGALTRQAEVDAMPMSGMLALTAGAHLMSVE